MHQSPDNPPGTGLHRRSWFKAAASALGLGCAALGQQGAIRATALTKAERDRLKPDDIVAFMKAGNERFRKGQPHIHDYVAQEHSSADGQYPAAVILGCIDSRAPAEILLDTRIGDAFNARVAGNVVDDDLLGSLEYACAVAGAKVVLVLGHTSCGAIKGAIDNVVLGNLTGLLARVKPAMVATAYSGEKTSKNHAYADAVSLTNVRLSVRAIRQRSDVLADLESKGSVKIVGSMYDVSNGLITFL